MKLENLSLQENLKTLKEAHNASVEERENELVAREGVVSDKEAWLTEKEKSLRDIHAELERFHGKRIQVVFPK